MRRCLALTALLCSLSAQAIDGDLDPSFAGSGHKLVDVSSGVGDYGKVMRLEADGGIFMAGTCTKAETNAGQTFNFNKFCATRLRADGSYDTRFGPGGVGYLRFDRFENQGFPHNSMLASAIRLNDGRYVFLGTGTDSARVLIAVLDATGSTLDTSVAAGAGFFSFQFGAAASQPATLLLQPDGKLLVVGQAIGPNGNDDMAAARFLPDFSLDTGFGNGGYQTVAFDLGGPAGINTDTVLDVALQADGRIVLAGGAIKGASNAVEAAFARLLPNGQLDADFGANHDGRAHYAYDAVTLASALRIDAQGRLVLVGAVQNSAATVSRGLVNRLLADGSQDPSFNTFLGMGNAQLFYGSPIGGFNFSCTLSALALQADGSVFAAGTTFRNAGATTTYFMAVKLLADGSFAPGNSFGIGGKAYNSFGPSFADSSVDQPSAIALGNGGLMIGGVSVNAAGTDIKFGIAKLKLDGIFSQGFEN